MREFFNKLSLININSIINADFFKCMNANRQISRFVHIINITRKMRFVISGKNIFYSINDQITSCRFWESPAFLSFLHKKPVAQIAPLYIKKAYGYRTLLSSKDSEETILKKNLCTNDLIINF